MLLPFELQGLLEVMASAGQAGGPSAEVSTLLAVCIRDSLESAFQWHIEQTGKDADSDAVRICLLAKASVNLLGVEVTTFSPVLAPYLPIAADVAAKALHELFGSQLLPWLATGSDSSTCYNVQTGRSACELIVLSLHGAEGCGCASIACQSVLHCPRRSKRCHS